jgi:hypothetical protein
VDVSEQGWRNLLTAQGVARRLMVLRARAGQVGAAVLSSSASAFETTMLRLPGCKSRSR